jgi:hypothetical protein
LKRKAVKHLSDSEHNSRPSVGDVCSEIVDFNRYKAMPKEQVPKMHPPALLFSHIGENYNAHDLQILLENLLMQKYT